MPANVTITKTEVLADEKYPLKKVSFVRQTDKGGQQKEDVLVFDPGDAATVLLYNKEKKTVILIKQFRLPSYLNQNPSGMLIETCAGKLNKGETPEESVRREAEEETGYKINEIKKLFRVYMSAGAITEILHFFIAAYTDESKVSEGGGLKEEQEDIEIMEVDFKQAIAMIGNGGIQDAKTIILLLYAQTQGYFE